MEETETIEEPKSYDTRDRLAKLLLGTLVGFIAKEIAENVYESVVERRRASTAEVQQ